MIDLITRETLQCTPRQAIVEMYGLRGGVASCPKWYEKRLDKIGQYLAGCKYKGRPLLDEPMSMSSIDAVLKEAWAVVNSPRFRQLEYERAVQDAQRSVH